ncbi:bifunctional serine/threonine-protein kinase/formylglycine-generating enzyme family protein [Luteimonas aquatica]|uniref:bifunctional serine/threonine-protein kinase/formylglycine-generating enzyme family protein n=1 Tax=Luteimonas aquatica TaxID=450364 RepID=UPI001F56C390|nr:bifunctional serine/threonine-protein kinase/formylglycine-generating enzyme family protein [Luteimonas aquatica]
MHKAPQDRTRDPALPDIAGYRLSRVIGSGGMSTVYLADQVSLDRQVAIKVMLPEALADEVSRRRFENEARTIARLEHPHIVGIYEVGRTRDGLPYYAMPHLSRGHLGERIAAAGELGMDPQRVRDILHALLSALGYAHARGTIHRDVKAENVLFDDADRPMLADFGIALRRGYGARVTTTGFAVGSTAYMAPEQARGDEVDHRTDLYAVGVLAWEMLVGELPYNAADAVSMAVMHVKDPIPRLPFRLRHWQKFFDRALAKGPLKRFRDARHMQESLDQVPHRQVTREILAVPALRRGAGVLGAMPLLGWFGVLVLIAAALGLFLHGTVETPGGVQAPPAAIATAPAAAPPAPTMATQAAAIAPAGIAEAAAAAPSNDPAQAMLRAAPSSEAERWVADADAQIRAGRLLTPKNGNAFDSLLAASRRDPGYDALLPALGRLVDALGREAVRAVGKGDDARARQQVAAAAQIVQRLQQPGHPAIGRLRADVAKAYDARVDRAAADFDREAGKQAVAGAKGSGALESVDLRKLTARANRIPASGERLKQAGDMLLVRGEGHAFAAAPGPVSRDEYARFAAATRREMALCRERGSLLRLFSPRNWKSPGFAQVGSQPVVCVSWADAEAYAHWRSAQDGRRYRLPNAAEAKLLPADPEQVRAVAEWNNDCDGHCAKRLSNGSSWRGAKGARGLPADRGYDDVGIRLVSDLPDAVAKR